MRRDRVRVGFVGAIVLALGWAIVDTPDAPAIAAPACSTAVLVDGRLLCDDEVAAALATECPLALATTLDDGDAIDTAAGCARGRMPPHMLHALAVVIDVNTASVDDLGSLPGIGPALARRIVAGRPYASPDDLVAVSGIGPKKLAAMRPRVVAGVQSDARRPSP